MSTLENSDPSFRGHRKSNAVALKLKDAIEAGGTKNRNAWAEEFQVTVGKIGSSLTWLRKHGYMFYPPKHGDPIKDILKDQEDIRQTVNRQDINYLAPQLEAISRIIEQAVGKYPELAPIFQNFLLEKATRLSVIKEHINGNRQLADKSN